MDIAKAKERVFNKCNLIGENCDVYSILFKYKVFRDLSNKELDEIYDELVERLGF